MSRYPLLSVVGLFVCLSGWMPFKAHAADASLSVSNACEVLKNFHGEYSFGGLGEGSESNDGELALWIIFHSPKAAETLSNIYPQCAESGKAYALAALYHLDRKAFASLTNAFCSEPNDIITGVGCTESSLSREELLADMQKKTWLAFDPSRKPYRHSQMAFFNHSRDVYAEHRLWEEEQKKEKERGYALLQSNPKLSAFTNLFDVESATADFGSFYGVYFKAKSEWSGDFAPREKLAFPALAETVFPKDGDVVDVGVAPEQVIVELKNLANLPFVRLLDSELGVQCVRIRVAGNRLQWDSADPEAFEKRLHTGVPPTEWTHCILDVGRKEHRMISFYHPKGVDLYVVDEWLFESENWRQQYKKITGKTPKKMEIGEWGNPDPKYLPVVDKEGTLRLIN